MKITLLRLSIDAEHGAGVVVGKCNFDAIGDGISITFPGLSLLFEDKEYALKMARMILDVCKEGEGK